MGKRAPSTERMNLLYSNDTQGNYPESWYSATTQHLNAFPSLKGSKKYDICIIGAGYTGLSAALHSDSISSLYCEVNEPAYEMAPELKPKRGPGRPPKTEA